jgi:hypothetical protein
MAVLGRHHCDHSRCPRDPVDRLAAGHDRLPTATSAPLAIVWHRPAAHACRDHAGRLARVRGTPPAR